MMTSLLPLCKRHLNGAFVVFIKRSPPLAGFFFPKKETRGLKRWGLGIIVFLALWVFFQRFFVGHVYRKKEKDHLK
ncbi:hypothetical protein [Escherichia coli]|uniref:hypothetical protein n=1 Tax=Escherichia coli TaxID=562 RepID=UPI0012FFBC80|nr:hypothetical protein [Escherichia coli]